jgi:hypothetical protein
MSIVSTPVLRRLGYGVAFWIGAMHGYSLSVKDVSNRIRETAITLLRPGNRASRRMLFEIELTFVAKRSPMIVEVNDSQPQLIKRKCQHGD